MKLTSRGWLRSAGRVTVCAITLWQAGMAAQAQAVSTTTVQGTVYLANGQPAGGTLVVSWPTFTTAAGQLIPAGQTTVTVGADGYVSVNLAPNQGATPAGEYYTAVFYKSDGTVSTQYWTVPAAAQASLAQVQAQIMPAAQAVQAVSKAYVDQAVSQALGSQLSGSGGNLTGPLYLSGDPTQPMQAADKHYVDSSFSAALPLSGGTMTGPANFNAAVTFGSNVTASSGIGFTGTGAAQTLANLLPGASSDGSNGMTLTGTSTPNASAPKVSPVADIRAYGATIDGATDIGTALQSAINACNVSNGNACTVLLPCGGPNGCYLANGSLIAWYPSPNKILHIKQQGTLYLGSTLVMPGSISWTCDGGGEPVQFQYSGQNCTIEGKTAVQGTLGTAITTTGSAVTFTPTYTSGSASNFNVNSAITVAGLQTCSATASRTSASSGQNTVFTFSGCTDSSGNAETGPRTPVGSTITVTGCSDSSFNVTGAVVNAQDWPNNTETIYESGATGATTGCTVTGYDDNTFETVRITAASSGTMTATFAHKHAASDVYGMVTVAPVTANDNHHDIQGAAIYSMGGASLWLDNVAEINLSDDGFIPSTVNAITAFSVECDGCWQGDWNKDSFLQKAPTQHCVSNCSAGYPFGIRFSQDAARSDGIGGDFIQISNSTILGGIKVDGNGMSNSSGEGPQIGPLASDVFEQTTLAAVAVDPRYSLGGPISISMNYSILQDNFQSNNQYYVGGTDCCVSGFADLGDLTAFAAAYVSTLANTYFPNQVQAKNVGKAVNPASNGFSTGILTDGNTIIGNFRGRGASFSPSIVPSATLSVSSQSAVLSACGANCTSAYGPDGVSGSAVEIQAGSGGAQENVSVGSNSVSTYAGDWILFWGWFAPGANNTGALGSSYGYNDLLDIHTYGTDTLSTVPGGAGASTIFGGGDVNLSNDSWHSGVTIAKVITGESAAHNINLSIFSPSGTAGEGNRFWDWGYMLVPGPNNPSYTGVTQQEVVRWAQQLLHGYVPGGASPGILYVNPSYQFNLLKSGASSCSSGSPYMKYDGTCGSGAAASGVPTVATVAPSTTSSTTGTSTTAWYTPGAAGEFRACAYLDNTVAGTAGYYYFYVQYKSDGHSFTQTVVGNTSASTQWTQGQACYSFYSDAAQILYGVGASGVTGTPTERYAASLEQLQ